MDPRMITQIAKLNDMFRRSGFGLTMTQGVQALEDWTGLIYEVRRYNEFTEDNDPHGEHGYVAIVWRGYKFF